MRVEHGKRANRWSPEQRSEFIARKIERLEQGEAPRCLDLFAGCGGLSLGFHRAGFAMLGGIEIDQNAAASYAVNFHGLVNGEPHALYARPRDIGASPSELLQDFGYSLPATGVDVIVGGPPCPSFARVGRAKLRHLAGHPEAFLLDPRSHLYRRYLDYVEQLVPVALVMENVPDMLNHAGQNLGEEIAARLAALDYDARYTLLNAARYGVPQTRERFYLVAIHKRLDARFSFPAPTHAVKLPKGYSGTIAHALSTIGPAFVSPPPEGKELPRAVSARDAIGDLPVIREHLTGGLARGARRFNMALPRLVEPEPGSYADAMYRWPGFEGSGVFFDHVIRSLSDRDFRLFKKMRSGDDYPRAHALAEQLFLDEVETRASQLRRGSAEWKRLHKAFVPPYDPRKFPNKWRKMEPNLPARTLMAHLGKDSYSHIHYDSRQARTISVREAARLQSFPDGFVFRGAMNAAFRQIGNSVPPLMAFALARALREVLPQRTASTGSAELPKYAASGG